MPLSEEQQARIAANKKRALELKEEASIEKQHLRQKLEDSPKCEKCSSMSIDPKYLEVFMVAVCRECGSKDDNYALLNKSNAKDEYLLSDDTMSFLKYFEKSNPMKAGWAPMKLYLTKQVREASMKRWGDEKALENEKNKRAKEKSKRDVLKLQETASSLAGGAGSSIPAAARCGGGFELEGDEASGVIFNKMVAGIDETVFGSTTNADDASPKPRKKQKLTFSTYNQAVVEQRDAKGLRLIAKADAKDSKKGGGAKCIAKGDKAKKQSKGGGNKALQAMINSIRGS